MVQHNKVHQLPRYAAISPHGIRRGPFLEGDQKVHCGPGQDLWSMPEDWFYPPPQVTPFSFGTVQERPYTPPDDWPKEGQLLRVPQVVHLSPVGSFDDPAFVRLFAACQAVKATVEAKRQGKTWVEVLDWFDFLQVYGDSTYYVYFTDQHYNFMIAPRDGTRRFFGTNYLHVFMGSPTFSYFQPPGNPEDFIVIGAQREFGGINGVGSDFYEFSKRKVSWNYDSYAGYRCKMYGDVGDVDTNPGLAVVRAFMMAAAGDMHDLGFTYDGEVDLLDADSLLNIIATHYKFDPATGKDLAG